MKKAGLQILIDDAKAKRIDEACKKVRINSRAAFGESAVDFAMALISAGELVNLNGELVFRGELAKRIATAA